MNNTTKKILEILIVSIVVIVMIEGANAVLNWSDRLTGNCQSK